ncbi:deoxyribodipyrimidine photo-lyase [Sphingobacterium bovistauri]|uniref:Deoxyribodipyrimidine photo-lyase n=1 Tax=Sphingobacterium bovistauri TaxID=2781959 RepID=A0ABS7Z5C3_9SPHI|nr:deoxyribodipyrimidine photo-lyase [Sphingobacterium bovistauri]MCA5004772.1 deoxyribodipyrimidine photo-lyase [Sphingobacterium bovistauri]
MSRKVVLVWFRNDLRTSDNEVLYSAVEKSAFVIPVYIFDPRYYAEGKHGFSYTGTLRQQYILNSVASLKNKLQSLGGDLLTFEGFPEEIIPKLVQKYEVDEVYHHREVARRETRISELVEESLWQVKRNLRHFIGHTMYHKEDLPFPIKDIPNDFNTFKKKVAKESFVRECLPDIDQISIPPHLEKTELPLVASDLEAYGELAAQRNMYSVLENVRNAEDFYTVLSPYLALGVLSPAQAFHFFNSRLTSQNKKKINFILDGLLWRDYYRFMLKKFPNCYFKTSADVEANNEILATFLEGRTSDTKINSLITKLNGEGMLTRSEREYCALYFIYELKQPWLLGAAYFEQQLTDYAPASIYGFWSHVSGEGTSMKNNRSNDDWNKIEKLKEQVV